LNFILDVKANSEAEAEEQAALDTTHFIDTLLGTSQEAKVKVLEVSN